MASGNSHGWIEEIHETSVVGVLWIWTAYLPKANKTHCYSLWYLHICYHIVLLRSWTRSVPRNTNSVTCVWIAAALRRSWALALTFLSVSSSAPRTGFGQIRWNLNLYPRIPFFWDMKPRHWGIDYSVTRRQIPQQQYLRLYRCKNLKTCINLVYPRLLCLVYLRTTLFNHLKTKRRLLYLKTQSVPRCKHFSSRL